MRRGCALDFTAILLPTYVFAMGCWIVRSVMMPSTCAHRQGRSRWVEAMGMVGSGPRTAVLFEMRAVHAN